MQSHRKHRCGVLLLPVPVRAHAGEDRQASYSEQKYEADALPALHEPGHGGRGSALKLVRLFEVFADYMVCRHQKILAR